MTLPESAGAACCARSKPPAMLRSTTSMLVFRKPTILPSLRNLHNAIARRHHLTFGVSHDNSDYVTSRRQVEVAFQRDSPHGPLLQGLIPQPHLENFLNGLDEVAIAVEHTGDYRQSVVVAPVGLPKRQLPDVDLCEYRQRGCYVARLEELCLYIQRYIQHLLARENSFANLFFSLLGGIDFVPRRVISAARL